MSPSKLNKIYKKESQNKNVPQKQALDKVAKQK